MPTTTAVTPVIRTVTQQLALAYRYSASTGVTTVTRSRSRRLTVRMTGSRVVQVRSHGRWVRIPYVWSARKRALVYDHRIYLALHRPATPTPPPAPTPVPTPGGGAVTPVLEHVSDDPARHLLRRATYGPTPRALDEVARLGLAGWVDRQLDPASIDDSACAALLARLPDQAEPIWRVNALVESGERTGWDQLRGVLTGHMIRAAWSERALLAVMEDFWSNHFNVATPDTPVPASRAHYAHTLRSGAFGRFADLLRAATLHPSMLTYLGNRDSSFEHPNENQGRELLELHTVGVDAGYGEDGVLASARILTGLSVSRDSEEYQYQPWRHWTGPVSVMGFSSANGTQAGGEAVALAFLDHLAHLPHTAQRLAYKLARHFVADEPPVSLVSRLADVYLAHDTAIAPVLRALLLSPEFTASIGAKVRRPLEELLATVRALGLRPESGDGVGSVEALVWIAGDAGHAPLGWPTPDGYPDVAAAWASTGASLARWNTTTNLVAGWYPSNLTRPDLRTLLLAGVTPRTCGQAVDLISTRLFGRTLQAAHRAAVLAFLDVADSEPLTADTGVLTWNLEGLVNLLLDSPYHLTR